MPRSTAENHMQASPNVILRDSLHPSSIIKYCRMGCNRRAVKTMEGLAGMLDKWLLQVAASSMMHTRC